MKNSLEENKSAFCFQVKELPKLKTDEYNVRGIMNRNKMYEENKQSLREK